MFYRSWPHLKILRGIGIGTFGDPVMLVRLLQDVIHDVNDLIKPNKPTGSANAPKQFSNLLRRDGGIAFLLMEAIHSLSPMF